MNDRPYQTYTFFYHFPQAPSGGGMEHAYSTAINFTASRLDEAPQALASLTAHEFFHLWNVKRIRPQALEPPDYTQENYTRALWFSEGCTSTAASMILLRSGLMDEAAFLRELAGQISQLELSPARLTQSVEESSLDAWLEKYDFYRSPQRSISYYNKGYLDGILLDLQMRELSHGKTGLRDLFQAMNQYAKQGKFFPESAGVQKAAEALTHADLSDFFKRYIAGTNEIPWDDFFRTVGLRLVREPRMVADLGFWAPRNFDKAISVAGVVPGSDAEHAGLRRNDQVLKLDGHNITADFAQKLAALQPGDTIRLRVRSASGDHDVEWKLSVRETIEFTLRDVENISARQRARRATWLQSEPQAAEVEP
jgi:predicted metalloprotease with PDZ domain